MVRAPDACTNRRSWMPAHVLFVVAAAMAVCTASPGWGQATPTPAALPTATAGTVRITIGSALAGPGDPVQLTVSIDTAGASVAATGNDITFDTHVLRLELSACRVNPAIGKSLIASVVRTDPMTTTVRVLVRSTQNTDLIPDGPLYTCTFRISPSALPGTHRLQNQLAIAFTPAGAALGKVVGVDGSVTVSLIGRSCTGDCSGDGSVTVDELVRGVSIALGNQLLDNCLSLDANGDGVVTVDELVTAVRNALEGCLTPPTPLPTVTATPTPTPIRIFVRASGSDDNTGVDAAHALRTISKAAQSAASSRQIVVGPGTYLEGVTTTSKGPAPQALMFFADVSGALTGDTPGPVLIDATASSTGAGFKLSNSSGTVIDGFMITGAADAGIVIKSGSDHFTIRNCTVFGNPGDGIRVQDSADVLVFNNLVYNNGGRGVGIVGRILGSPDARIFSNTLFGNGERGITVGTSVAASPGALVRNNIVEGNGIRTEPPLENIKVFTTPRSDLGYDEDFDLVFPATFLPPNRAGRHDILREASFNFPSDGDFRLRPDSPAIDAGATLPLEFERVLFTRTTTGTDPDSGPLDLGFHDLP